MEASVAGSGITIGDNQFVGEIVASGFVYSRTKNGVVVGELAKGDNPNTVRTYNSTTFVQSGGGVDGTLDKYPGGAIWRWRCTGCHRLVAGNATFANGLLGYGVPNPKGTLRCEDEVACFLLEKLDTVVMAPGAEEFFNGVCYANGHDCWVHMRDCFSRRTNEPCNGKHFGLPDADRVCPGCEKNYFDLRPNGDSGNPSLFRPTPQSLFRPTPTKPNLEITYEELLELLGE